MRHIASYFVAFALLLPLFAVGACGAKQQREADERREQSNFHFQLAVGHWQAREVPLAIRELEQSLRIDPRNPDSLFLLGFIFQGRRDYDRAVSYYQRALEAKPGWHEALNNLGTVFLQTSRWEEAIAIYEDLSSMPTYATPGHAHNNLGWAYYQLGYHSRALEQFEMAILFQPEHCLAYNNRGLVHQELGNVAEARRSYEQAISLCSRYAEPRYRLAMLLLQTRGDASRAVQLFRDCFDLEPNSNFGRRCEEYLQGMAP